MEVEWLGTAPKMAGKDIRPRHRHLRIEVSAGAPENLLEDRLQSENGRPRIDALAGHPHLSEFSSGLSRPFEQRDIAAICSKQQGRRQAAYASSDHGDAVFLRSASCHVTSGILPNPMERPSFQLTVHQFMSNLLDTIKCQI